MSPDELTILASEIVRLMPPPIPLEVALWDGDTIATFMHRSPRTVKEKIVMCPSFPKARRLNGNGYPLWKAREVIDWVETHKEK